MFDVPFLAGGGWTADDDAKRARVAVISRELALKLFGATDVVGKELRVDAGQMRIIGVIDSWRPTPHYFDLITGEYQKAEQLFVPFETAHELKLRTLVAHEPFELIEQAIVLVSHHIDQIREHGCRVPVGCQHVAQQPGGQRSLYFVPRVRGSV